MTIVERLEKQFDFESTDLEASSKIIKISSSD